MKTTRNFHSLSAFLALALFLSLRTYGVAGSIPVTNYSFENPAQAVGASSSGADGNTTAITGWTISGQNCGVSNPGGAVPDGSQIAYASVQGGASAITTSAAVASIVANTTYTATVQVTNPDNTNDNGTYTICFLDNGQIEGSASVAEASLATGSYTSLTATYTPASANVGHSLSLRLSFTGGTGGAPVKGLFDNVQLTTSAGTNGTVTPITFTLPSAATTTGGIYDSSGNLVRTLWRKVHYNAGPQTQIWDGNDDYGNPVATDTYTAKVLYHNLHYVWDGVIGNTSSSFDPSYCRHGFYPIMAMAVSGTSGFEARGYNEGAYTMDRFNTSTPQAYAAQYGDLGEGTYSVAWSYAATDGTKVYYACPGLYDTTAITYTKPGRVIAYNLSDNSSYTFSSGSSFYNIPDWLQAARPGLGYWPSGVPVGTQVGLSAIAVQSSGNYLAVAVAPDNEVYLLDKNSGASLGSFSVTAPKGLAFDPNGDLWVLTGTSAIRYTNISTTPTVATTVSGFSNPLAVAVHPSNADIVLVADGGTSQQVKGYTHLGAKATGWSSNLGTLGGNKLAGPAVTNTKFWFTGGNDLNGFGSIGEYTYLAINTDGSFWLGDNGNNRSLHFSSAKAYVEQIAYLPDTLSCNIDANNSTRVFAGFLEYAVDYTKPILPGDPYATGGNKSWKLVNNWAGNVSSFYFGFTNGIRNPVTMSNGHTYCILYSPTNATNVAELTSTGIRMVGTTTLDPLTYMYELQADGSARYASISGGTATWYSVPLLGFDGSYNPQWGTLPGTTLCSAPGGANDPAPQGSGDGQRRYPTTASNIMVSFDNGTTNTGMHLGGVPMGGSDYQWEAAPTGTLDFLGTYDDDATYAGSVTVVSGRSIIYGYNGEFGPGTESNQFMHFYDDGLFVGEFGTLGSTPNPTAGGAGNSFSLQFVNVNGEKYAWHNDESAHGGLHRWHLLGEDGILEASGSGTLGSTIAITVPPPVFPVNVAALPASGKVVLSWSPVAGASAYKVKYSTTRGGPYTTLSSSVTGTTYTKTGLTNGTNYYFTVSAVVGGWKVQIPMRSR